MDFYLRSNYYGAAAADDDNDDDATNDSEEYSSLFGRRPHPLPANTTTLVIGNSHTRQMSISLWCQYADTVVEYDNLRSFDLGKKTDFYRLKFENNSTLISLTNFPLAYSKKWATLFENVIGLELQFLDAIVLGKFNDYVESQGSSFTVIVDKAIENSKNSKDKGKGNSSNVLDVSSVNFETEPAPTLYDVAMAYAGPIVYVSMFGTQGEEAYRDALEMQTELRTKHRRHNTEVVHGRKHIELLGMECGSDVHREVRDCDASDRNPKLAHRCMGRNGGHPDLVAWDVIESLARHFPQQQQQFAAPNETKTRPNNNILHGTNGNQHSTMDFQNLYDPMVCQQEPHNKNSLNNDYSNILHYNNLYTASVVMSVLCFLRLRFRLGFRRPASSMLQRRKIARLICGK